MNTSVLESLSPYLRTRISPDASGCWLWSGYVGGGGYGYIRQHGEHRNRVAHRVIYEILVAAIAANQQLDHLCRVRNCVRPDHLEPVTGRTNVLRGIGPTAMNARKTRCGRCDRPLDGSNLIVDARSGRRRCRECRRAQWRKASASYAGRRRG